MRFPRVDETDLHHEGFRWVDEVADADGRDDLQHDASEVSERLFDEVVSNDDH